MSSKVFNERKAPRLCFVSCLDQVDQLGSVTKREVFDDVIGWERRIPLEQGYSYS